MPAATASPAGEDLAVVEGRAETVARMFLDRVANTPQLEAYRYPVDDRWESLTWRQTGDRVRRLAAGLVALGVAPEERVAIAASTRYEWVLADLAIMCAGAATTTIYPATMASDAAYILRHSGSRVLFAENDAQIAKLAADEPAAPALRAVVTFDGNADGRHVLTLADLERLGQRLLDREPDVIDRRVSEISAESLATLIYTSGTTGRPKGVRLSHSCWTYEGAAIDALHILTVEDLQYLWLPLAHSFGKVLLSAQLQIGFPTVVDGRVDKIVENLAVVKPTFMGAAPRIFEKAYGRIVATAESAGGPKAKIFTRAFDVGLEVTRARQQGRTVSPLLAAQHKVLDRLVFAKIRARFGGRVRYFISGSAALNGSIAEWFYAAGILILEGYGLTETSAGSCVNRPEHVKFGSVGLPLPGTEVATAPDGEILLRGPGVMDGYHSLDEPTDEALGADGWFHTGDIGRIDADGFLWVTDRKKDLFKTSGGKYVAPQAIEAKFKAICPYASQFLVHGSRRAFCTAIITLDQDAIMAWAEEHELVGLSYPRVVASEPVRRLVQGYVDELNDQLNRWETIKSFVVLDRDLSVERGEMTPSLKVRRRVVEEHFATQLDELYA